MDYSRRIQHIKDLVISKKYEALIIDDPLNIFYVAGIEISTGYVIVDKDKALLFVDARYYDECKNLASLPVVLLENQATLGKMISHYFNVTRITCNGNTLSYSSYILFKKMLSEYEIALDALDVPLKNLRMIKDDDEIAILRNAAALTVRGFHYACSLLQEDISENNIAAEMEIFWKRQGGIKPSFESNISFGRNSAFPHHRAGATNLKKNDIVLMDIGVVLNNYSSDMTRIAFFGEPDSELQKIHSIVKEAHHAALKKCAPGTTIGELDTTARTIIEQAGYGNNFTHSLGHGVGLEVHEDPSIRNKEPWSSLPLVKGMVITIEPGIYLPNLGGIRIEDTLVITDDGHEILTACPTEPLIISLPPLS